jgi:hypothetical protein
MLIKHNTLSLFVSFFTAFLMMASEIDHSFKTQGFVEIGNKELLKQNYHNLYKSFDEFIDHMSKNESAAQTIYESEKNFLAVEENKKRYCAAPPSYRDPRTHATKRFSKIYSQFIKEHYDFLKQDAHYADPKVCNFFDNMAHIDATSKKFCVSILEQLEKTYPGIKEKAYGNNKELTVISKIVRYEKTERWGTTAHFDKSALSLIWDSNDEHDDSLILCQSLEHPTLDAMVKPTRTYSGKKDITSTILIPGLALKKAGFNLKATLHGVAPLKREYRHAVISFLLIPFMDMTDLKSDFIDKVY